MDYINSILNKFYKEENLNYEYEKIKYEILFIEKKLKENFNTNELIMFMEYQNKLLKLKKIQDLSLVEFSIKEYNKNKNN